MGEKTHSPGGTWKSMEIATKPQFRIEPGGLGAVRLEFTDGKIHLQIHALSIPEESLNIFGEMVQNEFCEFSASPSPHHPTHPLPDTLYFITSHSAYIPR